MVFFIDVYSYLYRSFFAIKKKNNFNIKLCLFVFFKMFFYNYKKLRPKYIFFIFDDIKDKNNNKYKIYSSYKLNRKSMTNEIKFFLFEIKKILKIFNIEIISFFNIEADDVIGSFLNKIKFILGNNNYYYILSYDKDFIQLIDKNIYLLNNKDNIIGINEVKNKYGIFPFLFIDFLILSGDVSDNIPGFYGIGKKTAVLLLNKLGNIFSIYNNIDKIKLLGIYNYKRVIISLIKNKKNIKIWKNLIKININLFFDININNYLFTNSHFIKIFNFIRNFY